MLSSFSTTEQARLSRLAALAVCVGAGAICLWLLVRLAWLLVPQQEESVVAPPAAASAAPPAQSVAKWHLFGNPQNVLLAQSARAPATTLRLTLRGTLALPNASQGIAMIEDEHGAESAYKVGDEVAGAKVAEVYADHVVLSHEGASETLTLPQPEAHAPVPEPAARNAAGASTPANAAAKGGGAAPIFEPPTMAHGAAADWSRVQSSLRMDPTELAKQVHVEPVYINGKLAGARLSGGGQLGTLISQAGLKPTDTVTAVNGAAVTDLSNLQRMADNLKTASSLQVTVLRDGKPATLTLNLK